MIELYYWPTPNGHKVTVLLEEVGLPYEIKPVDISAGDQPGTEHATPVSGLPRAPRDLLDRH